MLGHKEVLTNFRKLKLYKLSSLPQWNKTRSQLEEQNTKIQKYVDIKQPMGQRRNYKGIWKIARGK